MPFDQTLRLPSPTGALLQVFRRSPVGRARAAVQINHGFAEHAGRYARFADFLADRGFATFAHDHRGHGGTTAADAPQGRFAAQDGAAKVIADVLAVHDFIAEAHPGLPVIVFGHSMGGLVALNFVLQHPDRVAAAAIWNANFSAGPMGVLAKAIVGWERFRLGSDVPSRLLPRLTFRAWNAQVPNPRTGFDWLSRDAVEVDKYVADPLCGWDASVGMWRDVFEWVFSGAADRNLAKIPRSLPLQLVGGEKDPATGGGRAVLDLGRRMHRMGFSHVDTRIYPETRHESLNELNRNAIMADFADWADRTVGCGGAAIGAAKVTEAAPVARASGN